MSYATPEEFRAWFEGSDGRLETYLPRDLAGHDDLLQDLLDQASVEIDGVLERGGYTVPIDTDAIADAAEKAQAKNVLAKLAIDLAVPGLIPSSVRLPQELEEAKDRARDYLQRFDFGGYDDLGRVRHGASIPGVARESF